MLHVVCASFPNVEIKRRLSRQFELYPRIAAPQSVLKRVLQLVKLRDQRLHGPLGRGEAHQNKSSSSLAQENRIAKIKMGNNSGHSGFRSQLLFNCCECLLAFLRIDKGKSLNHQDHAVHEWRTKASGQLLRDLSRFATFDACCSLQMALGVKGKWKKGKDGG